MEFDDALEKVGSKGRYQNILLYAITSPVFLFSGIVYMEDIILMAIPEHWCHLPGREHTNLSLEQWKEATLPHEIGPDGAETHSACSMYDLNITSFIDEDMWLSSSLNYSQNMDQVVECKYGWRFDKSSYKRTITMDNSWVCDRNIRRVQVMTIKNIGSLIGMLLLGTLADYLGRRKVYWISMLIWTTARLVRMFCTQHYALFLTTSFFLAGAAYTFIHMPMTVGLELCNKTVRAKFYAVTFNAGVVGMCLLALISWLIADWFLISIIGTLPIIPMFIYWWIFPESARWLVSRGKIEEAAKCLKVAAKRNRKPIPPNLEDDLRKVAENRPKQKKILGFVSLFLSRRLATRTILLTICLTVNFLVYDVLSLNIWNLGGNDFLNFFLLAIIEIPGNKVGQILAEKVGRRWTQSGAFFFTAICGAVNVAVSTTPSLQWLVTTSSLLMKFFICVSYLVVYLQIIEIQPTCVRSSGLSVTNFLSLVVCTGNPYITHLGETDKRIPNAVLSGVSILGVVAATFLPETLDQTLPETLEDGNEFGKNQKFWSWKPKPKKTKLDKEEPQETIQMTMAC